jgi:RNA polymerase sigma-70 factor, ECF subfamily
MPPQDSDTEELVRRAGQGEEAAMHVLLDGNRSRLKRMLAVRMDRRLLARIDPSDVVQETLMEAARLLPSYAQSRPLPFYPWLRGVAWERLVQLHRKHVGAQKRGADREAPADVGLSDESAIGLVQRFASSGTSPSQHMLRKELQTRVRSALDLLSPQDREILVMRHLEQLQVSEIAAILGMDQGAVKMRRLRAARRLRDLLDQYF